MDWDVVERLERGREEEEEGQRRKCLRKESGGRVKYL